MGATPAAPETMTNRELRKAFDAEYTGPRLGRLPAGRIRYGSIREARLGRAYALQLLSLNNTLITHGWLAFSIVMLLAQPSKRLIWIPQVVAFLAWMVADRSAARGLIAKADLYLESAIPNTERQD